MKASRCVVAVVLVMVVAALTVPAAAFAGGDQVNRPDGSGVSDQQSAGVLPDWAPRAEQTATP